MWSIDLNQEAGDVPTVSEGEKLMKVFESAGLFLHDKSSFLLNEGEKKMGQWPIFRGASLRLPRLALPPLLRIAPSLAPGFWTDKHWQRPPPHWTRGRLRGEETSLLLPSSNLAHKLNRSALAFWLPTVLARVGTRWRRVARNHGKVCERTEDESWKKQETNNNVALNFGGSVCPPPHSILHTLQTRLECFGGFFGDRKEKNQQNSLWKGGILGTDTCSQGCFWEQLPVLPEASDLFKWHECMYQMSEVYV